MPSASTKAAGRKLKLRDGRTLGYAEYGDPRGKPLILCHGTPGSRLDRHPDESIATSLGARLIVPDRPGYGLSTFQPHRCLLDWPDDVVELADALGIQRFAVLGVSGGGPHAAACAYKLSQRLTRAGLVAAVAPFDIPSATEGMAAINRRSAVVSRRVPFFVLRTILEWQARTFRHHPEALLDVLASQVGEADRAVLAAPRYRQVLAESIVEAYTQGGRGHAWESRLVARPWGFRALDIEVEVRLWQGEDDRLVPPTMGRYLAAAIPNCVPTFLPGEGHLSVIYARWHEILSAMIA
jgi:pimeloyl-ACP methyl ester carboxylesterase